MSKRLTFKNGDVRDADAEEDADAADEDATPEVEDQ